MTGVRNKEAMVELEAFKIQAETLCTKDQKQILGVNLKAEKDAIDFYK
jgi:hypothetical protein